MTTSPIRRGDGSGAHGAGGQDEARPILDGIARVEQRLDEIEAKPGR